MRSISIVVHTKTEGLFLSQELTKAITLNSESALRLAELQQSPELQEKSDHILCLSEEMTIKLQHLRETPFDADLKSDLLAQVKALRRDPPLLDGMRIINPEIASGNGKTHSGAATQQGR
ncbi:MAG: hypothetical protein ACRC12_00360 [Holosporales bacterium]